MLTGIEICFNFVSKRGEIWEEAILPAVISTTELLLYLASSLCYNPKDPTISKHPMPTSIPFETISESLK